MTEETKHSHESAEETHVDESGEKQFEFVEEPTFEITEKEDCAYEVKVSIATANEAKLSEEVFEDLRHEAEVPGFRRGRAPRKLIERKFSKAVHNDVEGRLVQAAFTKLLKDKEFKPMGVPDIDGLEDRAEGAPLTFTLKFEVEPKVELGKYRGIEIERPIYPVTDALIDRSISGMQSRFAIYETVEDAEAQDTDQLVISFVGKVDGEEFAGGKAENYPYILGSKRFFPEFEAALLGAKAGATVTCQITFPDDYNAEHLAGKTADFSITISEIKRHKLPEWNDDLAKQVGYEDATQGRAKIAEQLRERLDEESKEIAQDRALKTIVESSKFDLPQTLIKSMANELFEERVDEFRTMHMPAAQIMEREHELREESQERALSTIKIWTAMSEIAEAEGIEVTDEDFEKEALSMSARTGVAVDSVAKFLGDETRRGSYARRILHAKVLEVILSHAQITDKESSPEEESEEK